MRKFLITLLLACMGLFGLTYHFDVEPLYYWLGITALVLLLLLIVAELIIWRMKKEDMFQTGNSP